MVIVKENTSVKSSLKESFSLEDIVGLGGFDGYTIRGPNIYVENYKGILGGSSIVQGPGSVTPQDISLIHKKRAIVSIPIKDIHSIGMRNLNVILYLKDKTVIEFIRG